MLTLVLTPVLLSLLAMQCNACRARRITDSFESATYVGALLSGSWVRYGRESLKSGAAAEEARHRSHSAVLLGVGVVVGGRGLVLCVP